MPPKPNKSRPGCWTCKRRHRKCDESLPSCRKCSLHGEECEGYGAQRLAFRDCTVTSSSRRNKNQHQRQPQPQHRKQVSPPMQSRSLLPADLMVASQGDMPILKEFIESVAQALALSESHNFWREDIAPLISSGEEQKYLRHSIIAVTLMHRTHHEYQITPDAARHYDYALHDLRQALGTIENERNPRQLDSVLASLFLLMWFEILARDWHKWNVHLETLTHLISSLDTAKAFDSRFQRRLILAVTRLEVPNMLWTLHPPLLEPQLYEQMLFPNQPYPEDDMEEAAVLAFHRLHVIMAGFAIPYADWLRGGLITSEVRGCMADILEQLDEWVCNLPLALQSLGDPSSLTPYPRSPLQTTLFIHYLSSKLFAMHVLNPNCTVPGDSAYQFCRKVSLDICRLIADLGPPEKRSTVSFRGDVGVILPLSIVSMFLREEAERAWICQWTRRVDQEGMWCGRRRGMIIEAWARCAQEHDLARPFYTMVGQDNIHWKPGQGLNVSIMTYDPSRDWRSSVQVYIDDEDPPALSV